MAALLSLAAMGLGQLYNGRPLRAIAFASLSLIFILSSAELWPLARSFAGLVVVCLIGLAFHGLWLFAALDAFLGARRVKELALRRYNRWYLYLTLPLAVSLLQALAYAEVPLKSYSIPSGSNLPSLAPGDVVMVDTAAYLDRDPARGDMVVFTPPQANPGDYIKRLVGLPGEGVQLRDGVLHVDGGPVPRERVGEPGSGASSGVTAYLETLPNGRGHLIWERSDHEALDNTPEYRVPPGHYFFLGDNRDASLDSRVIGAFGHVPRDRLIGRALYVYWARDLSRIGTEFE